ncbi:MAG: RNA polymerase sigma factor [Perlabentimonas sp.]
MDDKTLISEIINKKSQKAFEALVNKYQPLVVKTCLGFVTSYADAEDISQDVFIEVYQSLSDFRNEAKLSTWLYRIAVNKSLNYIRKQKRNRMIRSIEGFFSFNGEINESMDIEDKSVDHPDKKIERAESKVMLKKSINSLPENQRIAFVLSKYQDLSYKEIAEVMDVTLSSVESLLFRAKVNLKKHLEREIKK